MKPRINAQDKKRRTPRSDGGSQALNIGPEGVTDKDSPTINALKHKWKPKT